MERKDYLTAKVKSMGHQLPPELRDVLLLLIEDIYG